MINEVRVPAPQSRREAWASAEAWAVAHGFLSVASQRKTRNATFWRRFKSGGWADFAVAVRPNRGEVMVVLAISPRAFFDKEGKNLPWEKMNALYESAFFGLGAGDPFVVCLTQGRPSEEIPWFQHRGKIFHRLQSEER